MRASSSLLSSGTSSPRDARGRVSYGGSSGSSTTSSTSDGACVSASESSGGGTSTRFGRGGEDLRAAGLTCELSAPARAETQDLAGPDVHAVRAVDGVDDQRGTLIERFPVDGRVPDRNYDC